MSEESGGPTRSGDLASRQRALEARKARLSADKQAKLAALLRGKGSPSATPQAAPGPAGQTEARPVEGGDPGPGRLGEVALVPLSFSQERLWFLDRLEPGSAAYSIPLLLELSGDLDLRALDRCLREILRRHGSLRTTFTEVGGEPRQRIAPPESIPRRLWPVVDLSALPPAPRQSLGEELARQEIRRPFDLARGPLLRAALFHLGSEAGGGRWLGVLAMHHIVSDGWSVGVLVTEMESLYRTFRGGLPPSLPSLPTQYGDFAAEQRRTLAGERLAGLVEFWRRELAGARTVLELPGDRPRPAHQPTLGRTLAISLPPPLVSELRAFAGRERATLFMLLMAAFQALLGRLSGQRNLLVGTPVANRPRRELEGLIGFFVNTLVIRGELTAADGRELTFRQLLTQVRRRLLAVYDRGEIPFEKLVEELRPRRDPTRSPLIQATLMLGNLPTRHRLGLPGLVALSRPADTGAAKFDFSLSFSEIEGEPALSGSVEFATELFDATTVERWMGHFAILLAAAAADPERRLGELPLCTPAEAHQLSEWNDTAAAFAGAGGEGARTLVERIAAQAAASPEAVALVAGGEALSYGELLARAGDLARELRRRGVGRGSLAGLAAERGLEMVVGLLGILASGAAYVPLDPEYPAERLAAMVEDARMPLVVAQPHLAPHLPPGEYQTLWLEAVAAAPGGEPLPLPTLSRRGDLDPDPDDLAYVIFTSGSTGRPKGAANSHRGIDNRLLWMQSALGLGPGDRVLQKTPASFDVSVWEFFWPLEVGATLVMARPGEHRDGARLAHTLAERAITTVHFVPSMLGAFLEEPGAGNATALRRVITSGEALSPDLVRRFYRRFAGASQAGGAGMPELHNLYGPTEAAVDVTHWPCPGPGAGLSLVPIGRPVANTATHVVDSHLRPVPVGVAGELLLGGVQVGRGYLGRPALSALSFVPDPFADPFGADRVGARLYRTGDLVRLRPFGELEFLGRIDFQVKLRGLRIELGEIENVLMSHPAVSAAAVGVLGEVAGGERLVAWVVGEAAGSASAPEAGALRAFLGDRLPGYMVPARIVLLDALPLTPSGKVDRRALTDLGADLGSDLEAARQEPGVATALYEPPLTAMEQALAGIWQELLGREQVGLGDDFFELGGHSLLATRMLARLRRDFRVDLPVARVFETPTLRALVAAVAEGLREGQEEAPAGVAGGVVAPARPDPGPAPPPSELAPLSFPQERLWFLDRLVPGSPAYNLPAFFRLIGHLDTRALARALSEIVRRHATLRTVFEEGSEGPRQRITPPGPLPLPVVDLSGLPPEPRRRLPRELATAEARRPFDLARGPLIRFRLLFLGPREGGEEWVAMTNHHHIASDGWSLGILVRELAALYPAFSRGLASPLPELPVRYVDHARWQRQWLSGEVLERQLRFWRQALAGAPTSLDLPIDQPRPPVATNRGAAFRFTVPAALAGRVRSFGRRHRATPFMVLLAAFELLLHRWTGQGDLLVGTPVANRRRSELEGLIGFFVNTLVLRGRISGGEPGRGGRERTFTELLAAVRQGALEAFQYQDLPFERLVEELVPERDFSRPPLVQAAFALDNFVISALKLPHLTLDPLPMHSGTAKFELTLYLYQFAEGEEGHLAGELEVSAGLFDATTVRRLADRFLRLLDGALEHPEESLGTLPQLGPEEGQQLLVEWTDTAPAPSPRGTGAGEPAGALVPASVWERAEGAPEAVAVAAGDEHWSAGALGARARRLAERLGALGVGRETVVGLCLERSPEVPWAALGVWLAGAAYLPLPPATPDERLAFMLADCAAPVLVTDRHLARKPGVERFAAAGGHLLLVETLVNEVATGGVATGGVATSGVAAGGVAAGGELLDEGVAGSPGRVAGTLPEQRAYVIYTSGSTGQPKGVEVPHGALANLVAWHGRQFALGPGDRTTQLAGLGFDASVWEIWPTLAAGARLVLPDEATRLSPELLARWLGQRAITVSFLPTPLAEELLRLPAPGGGLGSGLGSGALRRLLTGGDRLRTWAPPGAPGVLVNNYGPTENAVVSTSAPVPAGESPAAGRGLPPIGRPLPGVRIVLLDPRGRPVVLGAVGELCLGGRSLARGYFRRPAATAAAFVPDPFAAAPGERLYRTGDLCRWLSSGELEFLGRRDFQVKVRGLRIELGEVEQALIAHPGVGDATVVASRLEEGEWKLARGGAASHLIAYVVPAAEAGSETGPERAPGAEELDAFLASRLPSYMVPSAFVVLDRLPLTPNGKVDVRALPAPSALGEAEETGWEPPMGVLEARIAALWEELLGRQGIGRRDHFFHLGGHSLLATRLTSRIRDVLGVELPLMVLFEAPTVAELALQVEALTSLPPLSFSQERLWFLDRLLPGSAAYNLPAAFRLAGRLDCRALARTLAEIVRRHASLRTTIELAGDAPGQRVWPSRPLPLPVVDLSALPLEPRRATADLLTRGEARRPFDLERGPLIRFHLLRLAASRRGEEWVALTNMHHIVSDGWSMGVLVREIATLYPAFSRGLASPLPELPSQYTDYALWQRTWLRGEVLDEQLAFWRRALAGAPTVLELPTDRPRPPLASDRGTVHPFTVPAAVAGRVGELARRHRATPFMVLLAAFETLLYRWTGEGDLLVGTPVANRRRAEFEGLIGFFVNTLVLRGRPLREGGGEEGVAGRERSFAELLVAVRQNTLAAFHHQDLPFERLVEELAPERNFSRPPLVQAAFALHNTPMGTLALPGLALELLPTHPGTAKFDLTFSLNQTLGGSSGELAGELEVLAAVFDGTTARRLADRFVHLLEAALDAPDRPLGSLPQLTAPERHQMLVEWGGQQQSIPPGELAASDLHQLFARRAAEAPDRVAVTGDGEAVSYGALAAQAGRLARALRRLAAGPGGEGGRGGEMRVALLFDRTPEAVVGILGALAAGAAYVPLDRTWPTDRLSYVLADAGVTALVTPGARGTEPELPPGLTLPPGLPVLRLAAGEGGTEPAEPAGAGADLPPDRPAYIIYTSGSTGRPKGVVVTHANVLRLFAATDAWFSFSAGDVWTLFHSYAFDFSVWEIWGALLYGGRLVVVPYRTSRSPERFRELLAAERVTVLNQTPSAFSQLQWADEEAAGGRQDRGGGGGGELALREVIFGGEALDLGSLRPWFDRHGDRRPRLANMYGITETTVHVTFRPLSRQDAVAPAGSLIGVPIPDLSVRLLASGPALAPVPRGAPGEIHVGGTGLARGYWKRPGLTAQRFIPDPFAAAAPGSAAGARLYRSGDLGRFLPDGGLEYLGRIDFQVQVRGFRVELGEIERTLTALPGVADAAVVAEQLRGGAWQRGGGGVADRLVAYVVAKGGEDLAVPALRAELSRRLPEYMVPAPIVFLPSLPLTANGKVDTRALPIVTGVEAGEEAGWEAPRGETEAGLAALWEELLERTGIGRGDHFFHLGGHSLLATRVVARIRRVFGVELPLMALFDAPTVAELAARVEAARGEEEGREGERKGPSKGDSKDGRKDGRKATALPDGALTIPRRRQEASPPPLSFAQERLWFLDRLEPGTAQYNILAPLSLRGQLDVRAFAAALTEVVRRHDTLRTTFEMVGEGPAIRIHPPAPVRVPVVDLRGLPRSERAAPGRRLAEREAARPFDLGAGPLFRFRLFCLGDGEWLGVTTLHHIASDGWSMGVLVGEFAALYRSFTRGETPRLPELPIRYGDFAAWQREWLAGERLEAQIGYWQGALAGAPPLLELPTDRPRPPLPSYRGGARPVRLSGTLRDALAALGLAGGATLFMVLMAAFQVLLARLSGERDLTVGTPVANRVRREVEGLIGLFVNTLVVRGRLAAGLPFRAFLAQARGTILGALAHQDLPFERLVEALRVSRSRAHPPLFQVLFALQNTPMGALTLPGVALEFVEIDSGAAKFDLNLDLSELPGGLQGRLEFATDLFDATTIQRFLASFRTLLEAVAAEPDRPWDALPLLAPVELRQLAEWNDTAVAWKPEGVSTLPARIAARAARAPDAVAVVAGDEALSYGELLARASRLASELRGRGVARGNLVGLAAERGLEMVVGLLGILGAGAAYVPLDPEYPADRLAAMVEDARMSVVLAQAHLAPGLPAGPYQILVPGPEGGGEEPFPAPDLGPDDLAYVIFTSGSTGRPKGAANAHRGIDNRLLWMQSAFSLGPGDRVLQKTPASFDVSVWEFFWTLEAGATLVMARPGGHRDGAYLVSTLAERAITTLHFVPSMLGAFLEEGDVERATAVRRVITSGEALTPDLVRRFYHRFPPGPGTDGPELHNLYGPTEAAVDVTWWPCPRPGGELTSVPIGRPIANTRTHVVDRLFQPVPVGVAGELLLGGVQVGRGYFGRPALTARSFVPDPFAADAGTGEGGEGGERLYRTGDLVRWRPVGEIEFLGRIDFQVKLRGLRIELGEIENALAAHPDVFGATVLAVGGERLVAYVVAESGGGAARPRPEALKAFLGSRLPEYMVPSLFVFLDAFPLTSSGKVSRRELPAPEPETGGADYEPPRTPTEELLAGLWVELLGTERVGRRDHFFELGGHSLLATRLLARLRRTWGVEVPLGRVFETPTLAGLAAAVDGALAGAEGGAGEGGRLAEALPPIPRRGDPSGRPGGEGLLPLSFAQERLWFIDRLEPGSPAYNLPAAFAVWGDLDLAACRRALAAIVRRHETLRTVFEEVGGEARQRVAPPGPAGDFPLPVLDLGALAPAAARRCADEILTRESARAFDLVRGPLLRCLFVRLPGEGREAAGRVLFNMHHIVSDGWSLGVLVGELTRLYRDADAALPELPVQYGDFALWQREWLAGERLSAQLAFWQKELADLPPRLELPVDRPRPAVWSSGSAWRSLALPAAAVAPLAALARSEGATLFMVLLAAWQGLLGRLSGQGEVPVGTPVAGRRQIELEGLIGFFVNTLVLRGRPAPELSFRDALTRVRATALAAFAHQEVPFDKLVEELAPERDASRNPFYQVMFTLQNAPEERLTLPGLTLEPLAVGTGAAKVELILSLSEVEGGLRGGLEFASALFDATTAERWLRAWSTLAAGAAGNPALPLSALPLLAPGEQHQLLAEWNDTASLYPSERSIQALVAEGAAATPEAVAVEYGDEFLTHGELLSRARRLARRLRALGVGRSGSGSRGLQAGWGEPVGLCLERSPELVVTMLAILEAGGAYVPLDLAYPAERLALILEDSRARVLVTRRGLLELFPEEIAAGAGATLLCLDDDPPEIAAGAAGAGEGGQGPFSGDTLAYIIYTSGSTGRPKGVAVPHRAVLRLILATNYVELGPQDRVAQIANTSFDAATFEIWGPLLTGGRIVGVDRDTSLSPRRLTAALAERRVSALFLTAALFSQVAREVPAGFAGVGTLLAGGEAVDPDAARRVLAAGGPRRLLNGYGPTESTTFSTWYRIEAVAPGATNVPIGRPLANTTQYVLDPRGRLVGARGEGELHLGGDGLAWGYFGQPARTAATFVPDPFGRAGGRLYKTGDRVRPLPRGEVEYIGRVDFQVKIRGFRIEPGEIEAVLLGHPQVEEAVVLVRDEGGGERRLVACVQPAFEGSVSPAGLRAHLEAELPPYMVPSAFVVLSAMPLTPNGKVDRRALAALPLGEERGEGELRPPRTPTEELLAGIWSRLMGVERVGVDDDFFALGGHSLLAIRLGAEIRATFAVELPLRELFENATLEGVGRAVDALLAESRLGVGGLGAAPPLLPAPRPAPGEPWRAPLSFAQERLYFLDLLDPGAPLYNVPLAFRLAGELAVPALARALGEIARRHASLRTTFETDREGRSWQVVAPAAALPLPAVDLSGLSEADREAEARRLSSSEGLRPFDLGRGPLVRTTLVRLVAGEHLLLGNLHHIVADGWSVGVLTAELGALYSALLGGEPSPLPELPIQVPDFALWQREWLRGEVLATQIAWWKERLAGAPDLLELPLDRPRPPVQSFRGAVVPFRVDAETVRGPRRIGAGEATPFMVFLGAFFVLLGRHGGGEDLLVGSPVASRTVPEIQNLIGLFLNNLVLRGDLSGRPTFRHLLDRVRRSVLGAWAHQDLPFERLVDELAVARSLAWHPLFQVVLSYQGESLTGHLELPGLTLSPLPEAGEGPAKVDLLLTLSEVGSEVGGGLAGSFQYVTDLFDRTTIERLARHFQVLLGTLAGAADHPVGELPLLTPAEAWQLGREWGDGEALPEPGAGGASAGLGSTLCDAFLARAAAAPAAPAVTFAGRGLSYGEVEVRSRALARRLAELGAGAETPVGLFLPRGPELLVGLLAIWRAGAVYLPLDPTYPAERLAFLLEDSGARLVLTSPELEPSVPGEGLTCLRISGESPAADGDSVAALGGAALGGTALGGAALGGALSVPDPATTAYLIYTSGSTGRPNGVPVSHRGLLGLLGAAVGHFGVGDGERVLGQVSPSFDASLLEIGLALLSGGCLVLATVEERLSGPALAGLLVRERVTAAVMTPAVLAMLDPAEVPGLLRVSTGGEACPGELARRWSVLWGRGGRFLGCYGPTEATIYATVHPMTFSGDAATPLGRPVAGTSARVVDGDLRPVPAGVAGELVLAGAGLARGYLGRPALTARRFVPDPQAPDPGGRLYRTGDRARWRPDGGLDFLGRLDFQVKLRGLRVELGEIENALARHPRVAEAAVLAGRRVGGAWQRSEAGSADWLVAWVVPRSEVGEGAEAAVGEDELRTHLAALLPEYMVPGTFVALDALPRTPSGKVDRRHLPAPEGVGVDATWEAPRDRPEMELARIWAEVLEVGKVGIRSNFFALGGHSLLAVRLLARVEEELGVRLPLTSLFAAGTVEAMATLIREGGEGLASSCLVPLRPPSAVAGQVRPPLFLVHPAGGDVLCFGALARHLPPEQPVYGLQARGLAPGEEPLPTVEAMAAHYLAEVRRVQPAGPYRLGGWSLGGVVAYEMARQLVAEHGEEVSLLAILDTTPALEIEGPTPQATDVALLLDVAAYVETLWGKKVGVDADELAALAPERRRRHFVALLTAADFLPEGAGEEALGRLLEVYASNLRAARAFRAESYGGKLLLFRAEERGEAPPRGLLADPALGWGPLARGGVDVETLPGNHLELLAEPNVEHLAASLTRHLGEGAENG